MPILVFFRNIHQKAITILIHSTTVRCTVLHTCRFILSAVSVQKATTYCEKGYFLFSVLSRGISLRTFSQERTYHEKCLRGVGQPFILF